MDGTSSLVQESQESGDGYLEKSESIPVKKMRIESPAKHVQLQKADDKNSDCDKNRPIKIEKVDIASEDVQGLNNGTLVQNEEVVIKFSKFNFPNPEKISSPLALEVCVPIKKKKAAPLANHSHSNCCVVNCKNTWRNSKCTFFSFPIAKHRKEQREKWIFLVNRKK